MIIYIICIQNLLILPIYYFINIWSGYKMQKLERKEEDEQRQKQEQEQEEYKEHKDQELVGR